VSIQENKAIARRFIQAWSADNLGIVDDLAATDITVWYSHFSEPIQGAAAFKQMLNQTFTSFPDMQITADELLAEGNKVVVRWTYTATHRKGEVFGIPPRGERVSVSGITVYRIADGKVVEEVGVADALSLMLQLGAVPAPSHGEE
jgi:steroid delta-isomerase-like uncharacterized protein